MKIIMPKFCINTSNACYQCKSLVGEKEGIVIYELEDSSARRYCNHCYATMVIGSSKQI